MICILALVAFGVLSIFSATHRPYFLAAADCVFRRATLRPCNTGFDQLMKNKITAKIMRKSPKAAKFTHKNFEIISWFFVILLFVSMGYSAYALYNLAVHGTCDPEHPEQCIFTGFADYSEVCPEGCTGPDECEHTSDCVGNDCGCKGDECSAQT